MTVTPNPRESIDNIGNKPILDSMTEYLDIELSRMERDGLFWKKWLNRVTYHIYGLTTA